ncbi:hypothetical protein [Rhodospirillum centenum]|uniref:Uncharacterized protein n=1 Tax=Rhodospirillum centenum (strain ATCC 51521 / SW) TaxID=414684 RepID=B6IR16_RHOCS|nr:hypothetical protein [Rhodospirillum centenum]ACI97902.1 hypothetical protein RC1_0465 [Rhodospirillum centenum SW]
MDWDRRSGRGAGRWPDGATALLALALALPLTVVPLPARAELEDDLVRLDLLVLDVENAHTTRRIELAEGATARVPLDGRAITALAGFALDLRRSGGRLEVRLLSRERRPLLRLADRMPAGDRLAIPVRPGERVAALRLAPWVDVAAAAGLPCLLLSRAAERTGLDRSGAGP